MAAPLLPLILLGAGVAYVLSKKNAAAPIASPAAAAASAATGAPVTTPVAPLPASSLASASAQAAATGGPVVLPGTNVIVALPPATTLANGHKVPAWSQLLTIPDVSNVAIPANYTAAAASPETTAVQTALNSWATTVGYPGTPLVVDGQYGPLTQQAAAVFQLWENAAGNGASLTIDGLAGPETQNWLLDFGTIPQDGY
jgi:hypothetical protein